MESQERLLTLRRNARQPGTRAQGQH